MHEPGRWWLKHNFFLRWIETTGNQGSWNFRGSTHVLVEKWRVGWCFQKGFYVHSENWGNDPTWLMVFQMGWNHQLLLMAEILHQLIGSLSHYLQGFIHHRWCRISSINSSIGIVSFSPFLLRIPEPESIHFFHVECHGPGFWKPFFFNSGPGVVFLWWKKPSWGV